MRSRREAPHHGVGARRVGGLAERRTVLGPDQGVGGDAECGEIVVTMGVGSRPPLVLGEADDGSLRVFSLFDGLVDIDGARDHVEADLLEQLSATW